MSRKILISEIELCPLPLPNTGELSDTFFRKCFFCEKNCKKSDNLFNFSNLYSSKEFYCNFCIRNDFHFKSNKDIFITSFRQIIGYLYFEKYTIEEYIKSHIETGLLNPLFRYDPETLLWFIDLSKIGNSKRRVDLKSVKSTLVNILFTLLQHVKSIDTEILYSKYENSLENFVNCKNVNFVIPSLADCVDSNKTLEKHVGFIFENFSPNRS